jgi:hypothetical protein
MRHGGRDAEIDQARMPLTDLFWQDSDEVGALDDLDEGADGICFDGNARSDSVFMQYLGCAARLGRLDCRVRNRLLSWAFHLLGKRQ